jgi:CBS domain-containing protein
VRLFTSAGPGGAARHKSYPVVDAEGRLLGIVSRGDAIRWLTDGWHKGAMLGDLVKPDDTVTGHPDDIVSAVEHRMVESGFGRIPIVDRESGVVVGMLARKDLLRVRARTNMEESDRTALLRPTTSRPGKVA